LAAYERSMSVIRMQKANSKQFESWLKNRKKMSWSEGLDIASLLIMPCQRTPRYQILLQNLLENTPYDHGDYDDLVDAVQLVKECAEYQNAKIRETNNKMKVHQLSKLFNLPDLIKPSRRLVREGDLFLKNSKHKQRAYLFNDLLLVREMKKNPLGMTSRSSPVHPYSLLDVNISQETPQTLCVTFADDNGRDFGEFEMIFDSEQLKDDWKYDLKAVLAELNSKKEYIMQTQPDDARQMKQMSRLSLGSNRNPTQSNIAELRKSVSVEKLFDDSPDMKEKDRKSANMKNFLNKLGINANNVGNTPSSPSNENVNNNTLSPTNAPTPDRGSRGRMSITRQSISGLASHLRNSFMGSADSENNRSFRRLSGNADSNVSSPTNDQDE